MNPQYENPPIREAVCEFRFQPDSPWDLAVPGLIYSRLSDDFPQRLPNQETQFFAEIAVGPQGTSHQMQQVEGLRFWRDDGAGAIVLRPHFLSISHYKPYPSWQGFREVIEQALRAYRSVASPNGIDRIGLRYINEFSFPNHVDIVQLEEYFDFYPFLGERLPQELLSFIVGVQNAYNDERDVLRLQMTSTRVGEAGSLEILLDLDYFLAQPGAVAFDDVLDWIDQAHGHIRETFEGSLKDALKSRL